MVPATITPASLIVDLSILTGIGALMLTGVFILVAAGLRVLMSRRERRQRRLEERWTPLLLGGMRGDEGHDVPPLPRRDAVRVLEMLNRLVDAVEGSGRERILDFARHAGLADAALRILERSRGPEQLVAAISAGRFRDVRAVRGLTAMAASGVLVVRAQAAQALVRIDPHAGGRVAASLVAEWDDCHPATAAAVLAEADAHEVARVLGEAAVVSADATQRVRLVEILGGVGAAAGVDAIRTILQRSTEAEVLARCLGVLRDFRDPRDAPLARALLRHEAAFVRVQAVAMLGRLRVPGDQWHVLAALDDRDWWVRHRAARALAGFPGVAPSFLALVSRVHPDRYARGALDQVLSESGVPA